MTEKDVLKIQSILASNYTDPYGDYGANQMWHQLLDAFIDLLGDKILVHNLKLLKITKERSEKP